MKPELARSLLLEFRCDERRHRVALLLLRCHRRHDETLALDVFYKIGGLFFFFDVNLGFLNVFAKVRGLDGLLFNSKKPRVERGRFMRAEICSYSPILCRDERLYIAL